MKKYLIISLYLFLLLISTSNAEASEKTLLDDAPLLKMNSTIYFKPYSTQYYKIILKEDSLVQFDIKGKQGKTNGFLVVDDGTYYGQIIEFLHNTQYNNRKIQLKAGTYYINFQNGTVTYNVSPLESKHDIEPNNSFDEANPIKIGDLVQNFGNVNSKEDYYVFTIKEKSKITLHANNFKATDYKRINIGIVDAERNYYISTYISNKEETNKSEILPPGTYYVKVEETLGYEFILEQTILDKDKLYKNILLPNNLNENEKIHAFLSRNDYYNFSLEEEKRIKIKFTTTAKHVQMDAILSEIVDNESTQIQGYFEQDLPGEYHIIIQLKPGNYIINARYRYEPEIESDELINYTVEYGEITYPDLPKEHSSYKSIMYLSTHGIIQGYPDGTFKPKNPITRRQVFTMLNRDTKLELTPLRNMKAFKDVPRMTTDYFLINPFYQAGIIDGNTDGTIGLGNHLTRGQLAKIIVNTYNLKKNGTPIAFTDVSKKHFAYPYIEILSSNGIALGYNNKYKPNAPVTREEFSLFLSRILQGKH